LSAIEPSHKNKNATIRIFQIAAFFSDK